jgi:hypothetical protein
MPHTKKNQQVLNAQFFKWLLLKAMSEKTTKVKEWFERSNG